MCRFPKHVEPDGRICFSFWHLHFSILMPRSSHSFSDSIYWLLLRWFTSGIGWRSWFFIHPSSAVTGRVKFVTETKNIVLLLWGGQLHPLCTTPWQEGVSIDERHCVYLISHHCEIRSSCPLMIIFVYFRFCVSLAPLVFIPAAQSLRFLELFCLSKCCCDLFELGFPVLPPLEFLRIYVMLTVLTCDRAYHPQASDE